MTDIAVGVDVGGSGVRALAVGRDGAPVGEFAAVVLTTRTRAEITAHIRNLVNEVERASSASAAAVGVGVPAFLKRPEGVVALAPNLPDLNGWAAARDIAGAVGRPCVVENDANAAAFGESWVGAGRGKDPFVYLGLGTGVGGGIVLGGKVLHGVTGLAGELGHLTVFPDGNPCGCGATGCLEAHASATGIVNTFLHDTRTVPDPAFATLYGARSTLTARDLANIAGQGDAMATRVFARAGAALGIAIAQLANTLNPQCVAIGGQVAGALELLWPTLLDEVRRRTTPALREAMQVVPAALGDRAGVIGAAGLAWREVPTA